MACLCMVLWLCVWLWSEHKKMFDFESGDWVLKSDTEGKKEDASAAKSG